MVRRALLLIIGTKSGTRLEEGDMSVVTMTTSHDIVLAEGKLVLSRKEPISALQTFSALTGKMISSAYYSQNFNL